MDHSRKSKSTSLDGSPDSDPGEVQDVIQPKHKVSRIGLDTVTLKVEDFCVETPDSLEREGTTVDQSPGNNQPATLELHEISDLRTGATSDDVLFKNCDGTHTVGTKTILNADRAQITIYAPDCMLVQFSMPRVIWRHNSVPVSHPRNINASLDELSNCLEAEGIHADLRSAPVAGLHICRNIQTDEPIHAYEEPLKRCELPYLEPRDNGYQGVKWSSKQSSGRSDRELTFYSRTDDPHHDRSRIQRLEYRRQRKRAVERAFETLRARDLPSRISEIKDHYRNTVRDLLPAYGEALDNESPEDSDPTPQPTEDDLVALLDEIERRHGSSCHRLTRLAWALVWILAQWPERLKHAIQRAVTRGDASRSAKYHARDTLDEARQVAAAVNPTLRTDCERLMSLREKLLS